MKSIVYAAGSYLSEWLENYALTRSDYGMPVAALRSPPHYPKRDIRDLAPSR